MAAAAAAAAAARSTTTTTTTTTARPSVAIAAVSRRRRVERRRAATRARAAEKKNEDDAAAAPFTNEGAFQALTGLSGATPSGGPFGGAGAAGGASDPFAALAPAPPTASAPAGFVSDGVDRASLPAKADADRLLARFDADQRKGLLPGEDTREGAKRCAHPPLRASCRALASKSSRVMLGICAGDCRGAIDALKAWTSDMGLPRGMLHGLDVDGVPKPPPEGPCFVKYNSDSGDAFVSAYGGEYRGVLFTPELGDGAFRQYGYLPLDLPEGGGCDDDDGDDAT